MNGRRCFVDRGQDEVNSVHATHAGDAEVVGSRVREYLYAPCSGGYVICSRLHSTLVLRHSCLSLIVCGSARQNSTSERCTTGPRADASLATKCMNNGLNSLNLYLAGIIFAVHYHYYSTNTMIILFYKIGSNGLNGWFEPAGSNQTVSKVSKPSTLGTYNFQTKLLR